MPSSTQPWLRSNLRDSPCPFCGQRELRLSDQWPDDVHEDPLRLDIKCGNVDCPVIYFSVLATFTEGSEAQRRGDRYGRLIKGRRTSGPLTGDVIGGMKHHVRTRERRERPARVRVERPAPDDLMILRCAARVA